MIKIILLFFINFTNFIFIQTANLLILYDQLLDAYKENKRNGGSRKDYLKMASQIEGIKLFDWIL